MAYLRYRPKNWYLFLMMLVQIIYVINIRTEDNLVPIYKVNIYKHKLTYNIPQNIIR